MNFDLTQPPPPSSALAEERKRLTKRQSQLMHRKKHALLGGSSLLTICIGFMGITSRCSLIECIMITLIVASLVSMLLSIIFNDDMMNPLSCLLGVSSGFLVLYVFSGLIIKDLSFTLFFTIMIIPITGVIVSNIFIINPIYKTQQSLSDLVELEFSDLTDECISLDTWRNQDEAVDNYINAASRTGRKPVFGEYKMLKAWMNESKQRQEEKEKLERAKKACDRMTVSS